MRNDSAREEPRLARREIVSGANCLLALLLLLSVTVLLLAEG